MKKFLLYTSLVFLLISFAPKKNVWVALGDSITYGEWVSSSLVESLISTYSGIEEVAVVAMPDEKWIERPMAIVVTNSNESITAETLNQHLQQFVKSGKIKSFAVPKEYRFLSQMPKTSSGKIDKKKLKAFASSGMLFILFVANTLFQLNVSL